MVFVSRKFTLGDSDLHLSIKISETKKVSCLTHNCKEDLGSWDELGSAKENVKHIWKSSRTALFCIERYLELQVTILFQTPLNPSTLKYWT